MAEKQEDLSYLEHDADVLRELIRRGIESGPAAALDFDELIREADDELKRHRDMK